MPSSASRSATPAGLDPAVETRVRAGLLRVVFDDQPLSLGAAIVFSVIIAQVLERVQSTTGVWMWLALMLLVLVGRTAILRGYRRTVHAGGDTMVWQWPLFAGSTATAVLWGWIGWHGYALDTPLTRTALFLLLGGVVAASSRTLACHSPTFATYTIVSTCPLLARLAIGAATDQWVVAGFALIFVVLMLVLGGSFRSLMARSYRLQFENADLVARLQRDVAARTAAETALQASEARLQLAQYGLDHARDMVVVFDAEGGFLYFNQSFCRLSGRTAAELAKIKVWENLISSPDGFRERWDEIKRAGAMTFESALVRADGTRVPIEVNASYVQLSDRQAVCTIARDLSARHAAEAEKTRLQHQLQETQRLESLGVLAGGMAHDFNNLLTAILGNASLARESLTEPRIAKDMLAQIEVAANQAAGLCRQMLAYAGHGQLRIEPLNISTVVLESAKLLEMTTAHRARLELQLAPALPSILADASQLRQVVLNLVHNAAEAIERGDGAIVVTTATATIDQEMISTARVRSDITPGPGVTLIVADNGIGMTPQTLDRIFEPFFTTKFTGRGLGLPAVLGIVRSHGGLLNVESTPGVGSTFRVTFSATDSAAAAATAPRTSVVASGGRALVVEDEEPVRKVVQQALLRMGYEVDTATDGASAVTRVTRDPKRYDLVVVDMTMPRMDGAVTLQQMRRLGLIAPCILMSGLGEQQVRQRIEGVSNVTFLQKPFDLTTLTNAVHAVMAKPKV
jgi:PAS domain S-box-containing protein